MIERLRAFGRRLEKTGAATAASAAGSIMIFVALVALFVIGQGWFNLDQEGYLEQLLRSAATSRWSIFLVIFVFVALAFAGFPQILLIGATVLALGARDGTLYAWIATMISATATFALGRWFGSRLLAQFGGAKAQATIGLLSRRGILASAMIRIVPSAPFIVVNAAAGAARIPLWKYWAGTGIGIVPKILLVAALGSFAAQTRLPDGETIIEGLRAITLFEIAFFAAVLALWAAFVAASRRVFLYFRQQEKNRPHE